MEIPPNLEQLAIADAIGLDVLNQLHVIPENVTLFACQKCGNPRPYFCIYDTRAIAEIEVDWACESCFGAVWREFNATGDVVRI